ncbi:MAG: PQQ-binding-like beta-propeller repeat protein [Bacteroidetes bacterium]|nr:PQQ-binding-like beta-propeller repeat protein [Bacteroidota bacterium]
MPYPYKTCKTDKPQPPPSYPASHYIRIPITSFMKRFFSLVLFCSLLIMAHAQTWTLWADGLPQGVYPRMTISPNHDIFFAYLGAGNHLGEVYKANTQSASGSFSVLPVIPRPSSIQNNIVALGHNNDNEPIVGIYRTDVSQPWLFKYSFSKQKWDTITSDVTPNLGGHCITTAPDGTIYMGVRWAFVHISTDGGNSFKAVDESANIAKNYPCYYPTLLNNSINNGAIFTVEVDGNGRVYAGSETGGIVYSDDKGKNWHPADFFACKGDSLQFKDSFSAMMPMAVSGNAAGIGFTKDNNVVWTGTDMWRIGWKNKMGFADMTNHTTQEVKGLPDYLIQTGQQVSKIVTTTNGTMYFHSGPSNGSTQLGIYRSTDGINWELFNDGITGANDGQSQGSLVTDGNKVFMATHDGKVFMVDVGDHSGVSSFVYSKKTPFTITDQFLVFSKEFNPNDQTLISILNSSAQTLIKTSGCGKLSISTLPPGIYTCVINDQHWGYGVYRFVKTE